MRVCVLLCAVNEDVQRPGEALTETILIMYYASSFTFPLCRSLQHSTLIYFTLGFLYKCPPLKKKKKEKKRVCLRLQPYKVKFEEIYLGPPPVCCVGFYLPCVSEVCVLYQI